MSRRVVVIVPTARDTTGENADPRDPGGRVIASFAITNPAGKIIVERAGAPVKHGQAAENDALVIGFAAACARAGRIIPDGLRVRVSAHPSSEYSREIVLASTVAGVAASNALLTLGMNDEELAAIAVRIVGSTLDRIATVLSHCTVAVHLDCDDVPATSPGQIRAAGAAQTFIAGFQGGTK